MPERDECPLFSVAIGASTDVVPTQKNRRVCDMGGSGLFASQILIAESHSTGPKTLQ
jgi:hypothetical protein